MGFITPDAGGQDVFVHRSELLDGNWLLVGTPVLYQDDWDTSKNKRIARKVSGAQPQEAKGAGRGQAQAQPPPPSAPPPAELVANTFGVAAEIDLLASQLGQGPEQATPGAFVRGVVKAWMEERGMGFISPEGGGDDAFVHRSALLDGTWLEVGAPVVFEDGVDPVKKKRCASNVQGASTEEQRAARLGCKGAGKGHAPPAHPQMNGAAAYPINDGRPTGVVKAWVEQRGMGFIAPNGGGEDLFVHRSQLTDAQFLVVGATVSFDEGWDPVKNKRIATNVATLGQGGSPMAASYGGAPGGGGPYGAVPPPPSTPHPLSGMLGGTCKAWIDERGMGFIKPDDGSDDVFVHRTDLLDAQWLVVGAPVVFEKHFDSAKGKWIAKKVSAASVTGKGAVGPAVVPTASAYGGAAMQSGTIKLWFEEKAFGFIIPDNGGPDVMIHKNEVQEGLLLQPGMQVRFEAGWDQAKNKYKATRCVAATGPGAAWGGDGGWQGGPGAWQAAGPGKGDTQGDNLFIAGLPVDVTEERLREVFTPYGTVASVRILPSNGKPDAAALLRMVDPNMAAWLVENLNGNIPVGLSTPLSVRFAQSGKGKSGKGEGVRSSPYGPGAGDPPPPTTPFPGGLVGDPNDASFQWGR